MQWIRFFEDGDKSLPTLLGGKGANLAEMTRLGLPVPQGFIITTAACNAYLSNSRRFPEGLRTEVQQAMTTLEQRTGKSFSAGRLSRLPGTWPLLVSVRSGAPLSMPGMLDTILNVGLTDERAKHLEKLSEQRTFVRDSYDRLIQMFARTVYGVDLPSGDPDHLFGEFRKLTRHAFPQDAYQQLYASIGAVFDSWLSPKAVQYRETFGISDELGTAVVVQEMVFGNLGDESGAGVLFTRDPASGDRRVLAEYLPNGQGEDVVSGQRTPEGIHALERDVPQAYRQLLAVAAQLERVYRDMQDIEFTIERGKLFILQTRAAKRTPAAAIRVAVDMAQEGLISRDEAVRRVEPSLIQQALVPRLADARPESAVASGIPSSPGAASGKIALTPERARQLAASGESVVFVRDTLSPDDVPVMPLTAGILTREGGATSHAAVVARGQGIPCVVGCSALRIDIPRNQLHIGQHTRPEGAPISLDGSTGLVFLGERQLVSADLDAFNELKTLLDWADEIAGGKPRVYVTANTPHEVRAVCASPAPINTIGPVRTDWMFYDQPFRDLVRVALLSEAERIRQDAWQQVEVRHGEIFEQLFAAAGERPVVVQLLSAPLDYLLPLPGPLIAELAESRISGERDGDTRYREHLLQAIVTRQQSNPRFGARGVRLFFTRPELAVMQIRAIFAGLTRAHDAGARPQVTLLLPNVTAAAEVANAASAIKEIAREFENRSRTALPYQVGAVLETPRAMLTTGEIAAATALLCVNVDALTETVFSFAREDSGSFLPAYAASRIFEDPLRTFDATGVGLLMRQAVSTARLAAPTCPIGVFGALLDAPEAIQLCAELLVDYVFVDPSHVNATRLALARARLARGMPASTSFGAPSVERGEAREHVTM